MIDHAKALALIEPFEGRVPWMYLDVNGYVTVGIGNLLATPQTAIALIWQKRNGSGEPNEVEISDEWTRVHNAVAGMAASAYRPITTMELLGSEIERLFGRRVEEFEDQLDTIFVDWPAWPEPAQLATLDLAFNLGTAGLARHWPRLMAALESQNWRVAADESHRPQSRPARNDAIRALFLEAAGAGAVPSREIV